MGGLRVTVHVYGPRSKKSWIFGKLWAAQMLNIWVWCLDDSLCSLISYILLWMCMRKRNSPTWWIIIVFYYFTDTESHFPSRSPEMEIKDVHQNVLDPRQMNMNMKSNMNMTEHCSKLQRPPNKDFMLSSKDETWSCSVANEMGFRLWGIIALWLELYTAKLKLTLYCSHFCNIEATCTSTEI